jgi:uncharacterized protein (DUF488 family)
VTTRARRPPTASPRQRVICTVGHSTRSVVELVEILGSAAVACVVDVRSIPRSRATPQFNQDVLQDALQRSGLAYVHLAALGGRRGRTPGVAETVNAGWTHASFHKYADYATTAAFRAGLRELLALASRQRCALMCAEAVWWRCHRRIIADHLLARGVPVVHLMSGTRHEEASLTRFAIVGPRASVTYPAS